LLSFFALLSFVLSCLPLRLTFSPPLLLVRLFRSVLSVKDEFYHRHIIQHDLFTPVFDLFRDRSSSVGNNLLSSAILEVRVADMLHLHLYIHHDCEIV
jgi:hypothetical protein